MLNLRTDHLKKRKKFRRFSSNLTLNFGKLFVVMEEQQLVGIASPSLKVGLLLLSPPTMNT